MPRYIPKDVSDDMRRALSAVWDTLESLEQRNTQIGARRFTTAGRAVADDEFVTKGQLENLMRRMDLSTSGGGLSRRRGGTSTEPPPAPPGVLPPATHEMHMGYAYADSKYGDYYDEVKDFTDVYFTSEYITSEGDWDDQLARLEAGVNRAVADGKLIFFYDYPDPDPRMPPGGFGAIYDIMRPVWGNIGWVEVMDEGNNTPESLDDMIRIVKARHASYGLDTGVKYGATMLPDQIYNGVGTASLADYICFESYIDFPGSPDNSVNIAAMQNIIRTQLASIPGGKEVAIVVMAYSRNYAWTNIDTLTPLQVIPYLESYNIDRVSLLYHFAWGRPSGSREYPTLQAEHHKEWEAMQAGQSGGAYFPTRVGRHNHHLRIHEKQIRDALQRSMTIGGYASRTLTSHSAGVTLVAAMVDSLKASGLLARRHPTKVGVIELRHPGNNRFHEAYEVFGTKSLKINVKYLYTEVPVFQG